MYEAIIVTTFFSLWSIERFYFYFYNQNKPEAILNLNTPINSYSVNNSNSPNNATHDINSLSAPLSNSNNAYYYTAPVYDINNKNKNKNNNSTIL